MFSDQHFMFSLEHGTHVAIGVFWLIGWLVYLSPVIGHCSCNRCRMLWFVLALCRYRMDYYFSSGLPNGIRILAFVQPFF